MESKPVIPLMNQPIGQSVVSWLNVTFPNCCHSCSLYCVENEPLKLPCDPPYLKQNKQVWMEFWLQKFSLWKRKKK